MAEPLKNHFGPEIPKRIAAMFAAVHPEFPVRPFLADATKGYEALDLTPRARQIARAMRSHLPEEYPEAARILLDSLGPKLDRTENPGMAVFLYFPHVFFVAEYGLDHFDLSMEAQYELTQRFTAEFSIRPFLERYPEKTLSVLKTWAADPSPHVRRLVSEGTRPRLPWAPQLRLFRKDPRPVLELLDLLKDDPELYVRRSVANNLNDIGKDHPELLLKIARSWMRNAGEDRRWIVRHALRSAIKRGEAGALRVLGFGEKANVSLRKVLLSPKRVFPGDAVDISFEVVNTGARKQRLLVDFSVGFVKADGKTRPKVFKLRTVELGPREAVRLGKKVSFREMTTRKHYPGKHGVDAIVNGRSEPIGSFELVE